MKYSIIKNSAKEMRFLKKRIITVNILIVILASLLIARLITLQVFQHKYYTTLSAINDIDIIPIEPRRGVIYDRNGLLLAKNIPTSSLMVTPNKVDNIENTITEIKKIIPLTQNDLDQFYKQLKQHRRFESIPLKLKLTENEIARFAVNRYRFSGVSIKTKLMRQYPLGRAFSHVIGYVGRINDKDLYQIDLTNYAATNFIGKIGIEKYYESQLHGTVGYKKVEIDVSGQVVRTIDRTPPTQGNDIYLTIDSGLQITAEKALGKRNGSVVAIQPDTGEILALVSSPNYDPNLFVNGVSVKQFKTLQKDKNHPLYNRTLRGLYMPGSTIKPFIAIEGLTSGVITASYKIYDPGWYQIPNTQHVFHDWKIGGHGKINLANAIIESCDTYFYNLANKLGIKRLDDILNQFNFGKQTGIDLGEELTGNVPSPDWKMKHRGKPWYTGDTIVVGIGQGFLLITPLQLASATTIMANRGLHFKPHLLYAMKQADGKLVHQQPMPEATITLNNPNYWNVVIKAMSKVITGMTGFRFGKTPSAYTVAAKTGTVQVVNSQYKVDNKAIPKNLRNNSSFIAFAPVNKPKIAVAVVVENSTAAPIVARKVLDYYFIGAKK
jgi:penicillin-binding protein 2